MKATIIYKVRKLVMVFLPFYLFIFLPLMTACSDQIAEDMQGNNPSDADGIGFSLSVSEQSELIYEYGRTRAAKPDDSLIAANRFAALQTDGDNPFGLQLHRMPLPMVGIHPRAVSCKHLDASEPTRALASDIVKSTTHDPRYETFHDSLTIWGYTSTAYTTVNQTTTTEIFSQNVLKKVRGWRTSAHWPYGGGQMKFYAVAPSMEALDMKVTNTPGFSTAPTFTYIVPDNPAEQRDLLYGESDIITNVNSRPQTIGEDDKIVGLNFQHILTAVRFAQGKIPTNVRIKSISLYHIKEKGTYTPGTGWGSVENSATNGATYTVETNWKSESYTATENTYIQDKDGNDFVLFLMPHTLSGISSNTPEIQIVLEELPYKMDANGDFVTPKALVADEPSNWKEHTIKASLNGDIWKPGYTVTYKLTIGQLKEGYYLLAENADEIEHDENQTSGTFAVHSFRNVIDYSKDSTGTKSSAEIVNWQVIGYSNTEKTASQEFSDSKPTWLIYSNENVTNGGGVDVVDYAFNILGQSPAKTVNHTNNLRTETGNSSASYLDLSSYTPNKVALAITNPGYNTANCYIVNRTGSYTFPLIYGNGKEYSDGSCFVDHMGKVIKKNWIKEQLVDLGGDGSNHHETVNISNTEEYRTEYVWEESNQPVRAKVLWQDVSGLIINPTVHLAANNWNGSSGTGSNGCIEFSVKTYLEPGNAVIALQMKKKITYYIRTDNGGGSYSAWTVNTTKEGTTNGVTYGDYETVWAWHIWVTDEVWPNDVNDNQFLTYETGATNKLVDLENFSENTTRVMPVNLGWVPNENVAEYYEPRFVWLKLKQVGQDNYAVVRIMQHARQPLINGTSTIYQWGRPTPLPAVYKYDSNGNPTKRTIYDGENNDITDDIKIQTFSAIKDAILHPDQMGRTTGSNWNWYDTSKKYNFWGNSGNLSNKTVYDPCPPGFCIPPSSSFYGFSLIGNTNKESASGANLNMFDEVVNQHSQTQIDGNEKKGGYFYAKAHDGSITFAQRYDGKRIYMPSTGTWSNNVAAGTALSAIEGVSTYRWKNLAKGYSWTSDFNVDVKKGYNLYIDPKKTIGDNALKFAEQNNFGTAMPIRPMGDYVK